MTGHVQSKVAQTVMLLGVRTKSTPSILSPGALKDICIVTYILILVYMSTSHKHVSRTYVRVYN